MKFFVMVMLLAAPAARALANVGSGASGTAPSLGKLLKDENVRVRETATLAVRGMGKAQHAIPALKKFRQHRIKYIADGAIDKIEGHPTPKRH